MIEINLIKKKARKEAKIKWFLIAIICEIVIISVIGLWQYSKIISLAKEKENLKFVEGKLASVKKDISLTNKKIETVKKIGSNKGKMIYVLRSTVSDLPHDAWLINFYLNEKDISISGRAIGAENVALYVKNLSANKKFYSVGFRSYGIRKNDEYKLQAVYDFSVGCNVKNR
jgi:hypothetical protein